MMWQSFQELLETRTTIIPDSMQKIAFVVTYVYDESDDGSA